MLNPVTPACENAWRAGAPQENRKNKNQSNANFMVVHFAQHFGIFIKYFFDGRFFLLCQVLVKADSSVTPPKSHVLHL